MLKLALVPISGCHKDATKHIHTTATVRQTGKRIPTSLLMPEQTPEKGFILVANHQPGHLGRAGEAISWMFQGGGGRAIGGLSPTGDKTNLWSNTSNTKLLRSAPAI